MCILEVVRFFVDCILAGNDLFLILAQVASDGAEESQRFSGRSYPVDGEGEDTDEEADHQLFVPDQKPRWFSDVP